MACRLCQSIRQRFHCALRRLRTSAHATHEWVNSYVIIQQTAHADLCAQLYQSPRIRVRLERFRCVPWNESNLRVKLIVDDYLPCSERNVPSNYQQHTPPVTIRRVERFKVSRKKLHRHKLCDKCELLPVIKSTAERQDTQGVIGLLGNAEVPRAFLFNLGAAHVLWLGGR